MTKHNKSNQLNLLLSDTYDETNLTIEDIKKDLKNCKRMIKRATYKTILYKRKIAQLNNETHDNPLKIKKGLSLLQLTKTLRNLV